jgi:SAM-dependent methyltransferase
LKADLLGILRCSSCGGQLQLTVDEQAELEVESGRLTCTGCAAVFPIVRGVPRFISSDNYAASFGLQWDRFRTTQLDSITGVPISRERFLRQSAWDPSSLEGNLVLDAGCGAGRFTEVALSLGAHVVAVDYSGAVDACRSNFGSHPRLNVVQADICALPFAPDVFDDVYCFGVLQHTPDVRRSFLSLPPVLRPAGRLAVDLYYRSRFHRLLPKYLLRPLSTRLEPASLFRLVERLTPPLLALSRAVGRIPSLGGRARYLVPVANYEGVYPLSPTQLVEFATLDTFDMFSPAYDQPQDEATLASWFREAGMREIHVLRDGLLVGRGVKAALSELASQPVPTARPGRRD